MNKKVLICNIPHKIKYVKDQYEDYGGMIFYREGLIKISDDLPNKQAVENTIMHKIIHGVLAHIGYTDLSKDEVLVTNLANAFQDCFKIKYLEE